MEKPEEKIEKIRELVCLHCKGGKIQLTRSRKEVEQKREQWYKSDVLKEPVQYEAIINKLFSWFLVEKNVDEGDLFNA